MNLIIGVLRKPFSIGAILLFWPPVCVIVAMLAFYGLKYWYITLGAFVFLCMIAGALEDRVESKNELENEHINALLDNLNARQIRILEAIREGGIETDRGWELVRALEAEEAKIKERTVVVNLDPLGHNIGRVWKRGHDV